MSRLFENYVSFRSSLKNDLGLKNDLSVPRVLKVVLSMGLGEASKDRKVLEEASDILECIGGQKALITKARKSIAGFKLREGQAIGLKVTLRSRRMYEFIDRFVNIALPRTKDFRGLTPSFDGLGNFSCGVKDCGIFPEVRESTSLSGGKMPSVLGCNVTIVTTAHCDQASKALLEAFGFPFVKGLKNV